GKVYGLFSDLWTPTLRLGEVSDRCVSLQARSDASKTQHRRPGMNQIVHRIWNTIPFPMNMPATPLATRTLGDFLDQLAAKTPTPGGGAVASAVGALGSALGEMVLAYSLGKKSLAEHEPKLREASAKLSRARTVLLELAAEDEAAYGLVNELSKLPEGDARRADLPAATLAAARVPLSCMAACASVLRLLDTLPGITNKYLHSDLAIAAILAEAATRSAAWNVRVNLPGITDAQVRESLTHECEQLLTGSIETAGRVERACRG
ncbi:Formiminotetrahydrofolate cyclodeaminase, partial [hydrothermal vent metagenome]